MDYNEKDVLIQNCNKAMELGAEVERFWKDYFGLAYLDMVAEVGGPENSIRQTAQDILYHKTGWLKQELQRTVDVDDEGSQQAQGLLDRLADLETQIVDTRPVVLPVPFDTFPGCDLSGAEYVLENGEKLRHCTYEPDFFMSENRLADGTFTTPRFYEAMWDADGLPASFRRTDNIQLVSQPITGRMSKQAFISAVHNLLPESTAEAVDKWIAFAKGNVAYGQYVDHRKEPVPVAVQRWLNNLYSGLKAVQEDFGEQIANQVCGLAATSSCICPGEMCSAAQYFQDGRTHQEISDMVANSELDSSGLFHPERKDIFEPKSLYRIQIESPFEAVGPEIGIVQEGVACGFHFTRSTEPGYLLKDGTALLECERDAFGNYHSGAIVEGQFQKSSKLYAPVIDAQGHVQAFRVLHNRMERHRVNQGYTIFNSEIVERMEFVLAESPAAPQPYVTWARNIQNDEQTGGENFFGSHYFTDLDEALEDFRNRVQEELAHRPFNLSQQISDAPRRDLPANKNPKRNKDATER